MANNKARKPETTEPVAETPELPVTESTSLTLEQLIASRKELEAQIRQMKGTAKPARKETSLSDVIAKQKELPGRWVVLGLLAQATEREAAGQPLAEALMQVVDRYTGIAQDVLTNRTPSESLQEATWRHLRECYPRTNSRTGPGAKAEQATA